MACEKQTDQNGFMVCEKLSEQNAFVVREKRFVPNVMRDFGAFSLSLLLSLSMVATVSARETDSDESASSTIEKSEKNSTSEKTSKSEKKSKSEKESKVDKEPKAEKQKKSKKRDKDDENVTRTARATDGKKVDLVDGMPPFLFWSSNSDSPKGFVLCLHELGMHSGVFEDMAKQLTASGYSVYSMDLRGFGGWTEKGSEGKMDLKKNLEDIKHAAEAIRKKHSGAKVFLLGEAMGGALALEAAAKFSDIISGAISSAPGGEHFGTLGNYLSVGSRFTAGNKRFNKGEELIKVATPKKELQDALMRDANVRLDLAPNELMACQFYMYKTRQFAKQIKTLPVMIVQGQKDGESRPQGAKKIFDNLSTEDKEFLALENGDHYVFEDIAVEPKAVQATVAWLDKHSAAN